MLPSDTRDALKAQIAAHLLKNGSKGWGEVRRLYPQVSESTFFCYVADVKGAQASATGAGAEPEGDHFGCAQPELIRAGGKRLDLASRSARSSRFGLQVL